jgi:hypothetical protein
MELYWLVYFEQQQGALLGAQIRARVQGPEAAGTAVVAAAAAAAPVAFVNWCPVCISCNSSDCCCWVRISLCHHNKVQRFTRGWGGAHTHLGAPFGRGGVEYPAQLNILQNTILPCCAHLMGSALPRAGK